MSRSTGHEPTAIRPELLADPRAGQRDGATAAALRQQLRSGPAHSVRHTRASCLPELGYSAATPVPGGRPVDMQGRAGVLLLLAADTPRMLLALVVAPDCNSAHTGLLANTRVTRP